MPDYRLTLIFEDERGGQTSKIITGEFTDFATAETSRAALVTAWQAASGAAIIETALAEVTTIASTPTAGARVTERMSATLNLATAGKKVNFQFPGPAAAILSGNSLDNNATWQAVVEVFQATNNWEISDGEHVVAGAVAGITQKGKLISVRSGPRTLPS